MGVHGLWKLLEPAGKPVPLETLENKVLAVDVSIWLYQLTKGFQTTGGGIVPNAHILGLFNRICKLLYYRIKPVFVFDGGVPVLKKETIEARKRQKLRAQDISERLREKLLDNLIKQKAVRNLLGNDDLPSASQNNETDMFALPPMPEPDEDEIEDSEEEPTAEISSAKIDSFCDYHYGKDVHSLDISSEQFKSLPPEIRHEILSELLETRKQNSWARIHEMPDESTDFSKFQMERLVKRRNVQRSLDSAAKEIGGRMMTMGELEELFHEQGIVTDSLPGRRIAADNVTRYVLLTGGKGDKNKPKDSKNVKSKLSESSAEVPSCSTETKIDDRMPEKPVRELSITSEKQTPIKTEMDESEFRENVYAIDQCMFVVSSSSDEELENNEDFGRDYAKKLSMEEKMSQEEILRLIKQQNSAAKEDPRAIPSTSSMDQRPYSDHSDVEDDPDPVAVSSTYPRATPSTSSMARRPYSDHSDVEDDPDPVVVPSTYPRAIPSTSSIAKRPYSDHSDVEDDPDPVAVPSTSGWSSSRLSPKMSPPVPSVAPTNSFSKESKDFKKSMSKLDKLINAVRRRESDESPDLKSKTETITENASVKSLSDSDSESGFIEVTEETPKSQYFQESKSQTIEIPIDLSGIEDDLFADVFEPLSTEKHRESEIQVLENQKKSPVLFESLPKSPENSEKESPLKHSEIPDKKTPSKVTETSSTENHEKLKNGESSPVKNAESKESRPKPSEISQKKSATDAKTRERVQKIAEIFNRVRKKNEKSNKVSEPVETEESIAKAHDENLSEVQRVLNSEHAELMAEHGKQERLGSTITQQMIMEAQELLQLFGLPYIIAPMEAEAQCAFLDKISLTEGTITDDSDIWLFGGQKVYKNFFDNRKYVLQFRNVDIEHFFRLTREQLIQMALLVGSDYTVGIEGVGPVTAMEILAYFTDKSNKPETEADIAETLRNFKRWVKVNRGGPSALGKKVKNVRLTDGFPNEAVIDAYLFPTVNESKEGFSWAPPDLDRIREYMKMKFGWKTARIDEILLPVMKRQTERNKQTTLDAYFQARPYYSVDATNMSKRVVEAINIMKNKVDVDVSQLPTKSPRKPRGATSSRGAKKSARGSTTSTRGGASTSTSPRKPFFASPAKTTVVPGQEFIPQREKDRLEAAKRKLEAVKIFRAKRKTAATQKKRKVLQPKKDSSYLSESSSGSDDD